MSPSIIFILECYNSGIRDFVEEDTDFYNFYIAVKHLDYIISAYFYTSLFYTFSYSVPITNVIIAQKLCSGYLMSIVELPNFIIVYH